MGIGSDRNHKCSCGCGRKRKNCTNGGKKPRKKTIYLDFGALVEIDSFSMSSTGSIVAMRSGVVQEPIFATLSMTYHRDSGKPKVVTRLGIAPHPLCIDPHDALARYDVLLAVDSTWRTHDAEKISVACIVEGGIVGEGLERVGWYEPREMFEFRNLTRNNEQWGWKAAIDALREQHSYSTRQRVGLIVDSQLGALPGINARTMPLVDNFYLPPNFELIYAGSDTGQDLLANQMLKMADECAGKLFNVLIAETIPLHGLVQYAHTSFSHARAWLPVPGTNARHWTSVI